MSPYKRTPIRRKQVGRTHNVGADCTISPGHHDTALAGQWAKTDHFVYRIHSLRVSVNDFFSISHSLGCRRDSSQAQFPLLHPPRLPTDHFPEFRRNLAPMLLRYAAASSSLS